MSETASQSATAPRAPQRPGWHLRPFAGRYRENLLVRFMPALWGAVEKWISTALAKEGRFAESVGLEYQRAEMVAVLRNLDEWDGFLVCQLLTHYGWQCDAALVQIVHRWSCECHTILCRESARK